MEVQGNVARLRPGIKPCLYKDTSERQQAVVEAHSMNPFKTTSSTALELDIKTWTVRRHLRKAGFNARIPARKILLNEEHRAARVRFANDFLNFDWINNVVIFTDEKCFKSDKDGRKILWRRKGDRYNQSCILPCRSSGRISLGYWGWMSSMGPGELVPVGARFNSALYLEILREVMLPSVRAHYPDEHIYFVQDNCAIHRAAIVREWLNAQNNLTVINWPAKSPDLNPIENLWGQMVLNWDPSEVRNTKNLEETVMSTWDNLRGGDMCWTMVTGMRSRLEQVIDKNGAPLHY